MSDLPTLSATPITTTINGTEYKFSPLTLRDMGEFEQWALDRKLETALRAVPKDDFILRQHLIKSILDESAQNSLSINSELMSVRGQIHALYLCAKHNHSELTEDELADVMTPQAIIELLLRVGIFQPTEETPTEDKPKKQSKNTPAPGQK